MDQKQKDTTARVSTLVLGLIGAFLAVANDIKDIPALAPYSNWSTAIIGLAISLKQILLLMSPPKPEA